MTFEIVAILGGNYHGCVPGFPASFELLESSVFDVHQTQTKVVPFPFTIDGYASLVSEVLWSSNMGDCTDQVQTVLVNSEQMHNRNKRGFIFFTLRLHFIV